MFVYMFGAAGPCFWNVSSGGKARALDLRPVRVTPRVHSTYSWTPAAAGSLILLLAFGLISLHLPEPFRSTGCFA